MNCRRFIAADARPSAGPLFASQATRRPEPVPEAGKGSAPEPATEAFPDPAAPAKAAVKPPAKPAAGPVGSDPGKAKLRFYPNAQPSPGPLFASRATRRPESAPEAGEESAPALVSEKATNGEPRRGQRPSLAAPDPAERILPNGADRKPPSVSTRLGMKRLR